MARRLILDRLSPGKSQEDRTNQYDRGQTHWLSFAHYHHVFRESFESLSICLQDRNRDMTSSAAVHVFDGAGFASVSASDDFALNAVFNFVSRLRFHILTLLR